MHLFQSKSGFLLFALLIAALRIVIGVHFYHEGDTKRKQGDWSAEGFFAGAKGPLAQYYHDVVEDYDNRQLLCVRETVVDGKPRFVVDGELTELLWNDFADQATNYYGYASEESIRDIEDRIKRGRKMLADATQKGASSDELSRLRDDEAKLQVSLEAVRTQVDRLNATLKMHVEELQDWLARNETELVAFFSTADRLKGFDRDGDVAGLVSTEVEALRGQVDTIRADRRKQSGPWIAEVNAMWDSYEQAVNDLRVDSQLNQKPLSIHRPFDQPNSQMRWINTVIPYFDMAIGISLIFGIFVRFTSLVAALFLASVIASQPPWIEGTISTFFQSIEMTALLVLASVGAGRFLGADYFMWKRKPTRTAV